MHARVVVASVLFLFAVGASAGADETIPDAATIYKRVAAETGVSPVNYREEIEAAQSNGTTRRETRFVRGHDYRFDVVDDSIETQNGRYQGDDWHQNANGLTIVHTSSPSVEAPEATTGTVTPIDDPVKGYRIATLNRRGFGAVNYVDSSLWQIVRHDDIDAHGTSTTTYGPRVSFGPLHLPQIWNVHNADTGLDTTYTRLSYRVGAVTDADVAMPPNRRQLVEFPPGVDAVTLPSNFLPSGHILIRVMIDGTGYDFLLDSGSYGITVDPGIAATLNLTAFNPSRSAAAGAYDTALARVPLLTIGALTMRDIVVGDVPTFWQEGNARIVGLLGFDFLAELGVSIDYEHKTVVVHRYGSYSPPVPGLVTNVLPIHLDSQTAEVSARINGTLAERITIDTGAYGSFLIFPAFARRHPEALVDHHHLGRFARYPALRGVGGQIDTKAYDIAAIELGRQRYLDFIGWVVTSNSYASAGDGAFGPEFLKVYDLFLDYPDGRIALRLNKLGRRAAGK